MKITTVDNYIKNMDAVNGLNLIVSKFPAFDLDEKTLNETLKDVVKEKLRIAMDSNKYGMLSGLNIGYDDIAHIQHMESAGIQMSDKQQKLMAYMNDVLPVKMAKDPNMATTELVRTTIFSAISSRVSDCLMEVEFLTSFNNNSPHPNTINDKNIKTENLAATLLMVKEIFPMVYSQIESSGQDMLFENSFIKVKELMKTPTLEMKESIYLCDKNISKKLFPFDADGFKNKLSQNII